MAPPPVPSAADPQAQLDELKAEVRRLRAELETRQAADPDAGNFFRQVLDSFPEQVAVFDKDLKVVYVNAASVPDSELRRWVIGHTDAEYCARRERPEELAQTRRRWQQKAIRSRGSVSFEEELPGKDGKPELFLRIFNPVFEPDGGKLRWLVGYGVEITEIRMLQEQLRQTQKLEAVGQLVSGVAHDFNNLLTALQGYSDLLIRSLDPSDRPHLLATEIRKVGEKAGSLTRRLLTYSRRRRRTPENLDLNESVREASFLLERTLGEETRVELALLEGTLGISIDSGQLQQIVLNLALNGRDAMESGGVLRLSTLRFATIEREGQELQGPWAVLRIEDEGSGIAEDLREKIFEPFFTTKSEEKGTGLGLSTVSGIARQNGGHVRLQSEVGVGSCFEVVFPEVDLVAASKTAAQAQIVEEAEDNGMETLLLVEDEDSVRELTAGFLRHLGYTVLEARDGLEALAVAEQHAGRLDLVLSDVVMPRMGGPELAKQLSPRRPKARWVFMSGYPDKARMPEIVADNAPFLEKPFRPSQLGRTIRKVLDRLT